MKREIKFRGICTRTGKMVYGYLSNKGVINTGRGRARVNLESVCQFAGLQDAKGIDIYEGDVVQDIVVGLKSEIVFTTYANFGLRPLNNEVKYLEFETIDDSFASTTLEVIGNIHEQAIK